MSLILLASCLTPLSEAGEVANVRFVLDGSTLELTDGRKVKLIGVEVPKLDDRAKEARDFLRGLLRGRQVNLERDPVYADTEHLDGEGKLLAYAYIDIAVRKLHFDRNYVNAELIWQGLGTAEGGPPFKYQRDFMRLEKNAKQAKRGLWAT